MKIGILGMGGIGSFIGAKLTNNYKDDTETKIIFMCRNKTKENIKNNGLSLITVNKAFLYGSYLSNTATENSDIDLLIVTDNEHDDYLAGKIWSLTRKVNSKIVLVLHTCPPLT